jgi:hypothetical protein
MDWDDLPTALAVYAYLEHRPPGSRSADEEQAYRDAWKVICQKARTCIEGYEKALPHTPRLLSKRITVPPA